MATCTTGQVHLLVYYIKLKSRLSVRTLVFGGQFLGRGCMDRRQTIDYRGVRSAPGLETA